MLNFFSLLPIFKRADSFQSPRRVIVSFYFLNTIIRDKHIRCILTYCSCFSYINCPIFGHWEHLQVGSGVLLTSVIFNNFFIIYYNNMYLFSNLFALLLFHIPLQIRWSLIVQSQNLRCFLYKNREFQSFISSIHFE